jgi:hypothetical protein
MMTEPDPLLMDVETLQNVLVAVATSGSAEGVDYKALRQSLLANPLTRGGMPKFIHTCRDLAQFWQFIKRKFPTYQQRREYIWGEFRPLLQALESRPGTAFNLSDEDVLRKLSPEAVQSVWERALERRISDPEGAITSARALIETVCKHILDDFTISYDDSADLPKLYRLASETLNIAPSQHTEKVFRQILGGCAAVVEGLGSLRNRLGDAHGKGSRPIKPAPRHAQLAVNLAGTMTSFLVATWQGKKEKTI